ncbi:hypothetical protein [Streptomyces sp. URMC 129]|uniref:hypothetical protein n=1 Tax=Streptomyces sp. URMC 129 TaxID=3423407 RepID=UPI003F199B3D
MTARACHYARMGQELHDTVGCDPLGHRIVLALLKWWDIRTVGDLRTELEIDHRFILRTRNLGLAADRRVKESLGLSEEAKP